MLDTDYTSAMKKPPKATRMTQRSELGYRHLVGRLDPAAPTGAAWRAGDSGRAVARRRRAARDARHDALQQRRASAGRRSSRCWRRRWRDFTLVLLDDASTDDTEAVARRYVDAGSARALRPAPAAAGDDRHLARGGGAGGRARTPTAEVLRVGERPRPLASALAAAPRVRARGRLRSGARVSDHPPHGPDGRGAREGAAAVRHRAAPSDLQDRWRRFCHEGVGSGDMVYGLMRLDALRRAGIFRRVLRPDRLLMAELTLQGRIRQVPEVLWFRRQSEGTSVERQRADARARGRRAALVLACRRGCSTRACCGGSTRASRRTLPIALTRRRGSRCCCGFR